MYSLFGRDPAFDSVLRKAVETCPDRDLASISPSLEAEFLIALPPPPPPTNARFFAALPAHWQRFGKTDPLDVISSYLGDTEAVNSLLAQFPELDCDALFVDYIPRRAASDPPGAERLSALARAARGYLPSFRSRADILRVLVPAAHSSIESIAVGDAAAELSAHSSISLLLHVLSALGGAPGSLLPLLSDLLSERPFLRFRAQYTFSSFASDPAAFGARMVDFCARFDLVDLTARFAATFSVSLTSVAVRRFANRFQLGCRDPEGPPPAAPQGPLLSPDVVAFAVQFPPPPPPPLSGALFHRRYEPTAADLGRFFPPDAAAAALAAREEYAAALALVRAAADGAARLRLFRCVFESALSSGRFQRFKHFLMQSEPDRAAFGPLLRRLFEEASGGPLLRLEVEEVLGRNREAAATAIQLFRERRQSIRALSFLDRAEGAILEELHGHADAADLCRELVRIQFQRNFSVFVTERGLTGYGDLGFFGTDRQLEDTVVVLLRNFEFDLSFGVIEHFRLDVRVVATRVLDALFAQSPEQAVMFAQHLENAVPQGDVVRFMYPFLKRLWGECDDTALAECIVTNVLKKKDFQVKLLLEFGVWDGAVRIATESGLVDEVALIAHLLPQSPAPGLLPKCVKWLEGQSLPGE
jgi:hypothetical protein